MRILKNMVFSQFIDDSEFEFKAPESNVDFPMNFDKFLSRDDKPPKFRSVELISPQAYWHEFDIRSCDKIKLCLRVDEAEIIKDKQKVVVVISPDGPFIVDGVSKVRTPCRDGFKDRLIVSLAINAGTHGYNVMVTKGNVKANEHVTLDIGIEHADKFYLGQSFSVRLNHIGVHAEDLKRSEEVVG